MHVDAGWNSELAVHNIEKIVKHCKYELHTHVIDWEEIKDLQSYRSNLNEKNDFEMSTISIANDNSESLQNQIIQLYEKKQALERDLQLLKPLSFVSEFPVYRKPTSRTLLRTGILCFGFLLLGFITALFRDVKSFMK